MNELVRQEALPVDVQRKDFDLEGLFRLTLEKGGGVETMERLMVIRREVKEEHAKEAYFASMAAFQAECPPITKLKAGAQNHYKYAPLEDIVTAVNPILQKFGFSYAISSEIEQGWVKAVVTITHREGHSEKSEFKVPIDQRATLMNAPQQYGAAMTFSKRYCFCNGFGILTADADLDGRVQKPKPAGPSSVAGEPSVKDLTKELWELLKPVRGGESNWKAANQWMWDEAIIHDNEQAPGFTAARFREVITKAKGKIK